MSLNRPTNQRGFTMIELLVVITVITLMMSLLVGASYRFVVGSRESATAATITKASGIILDRVRAFHEFDFSDAAIMSSNSYNAANTLDPLMTPQLAEIFIRKARFKKAFPQAFAELNAAQSKRFFPSATSIPPTTSTYNPKYECGIVLYALLLNGETFGAATPGDDTFTGAEVKNNADTGNLPCLVDAWGEPLRFYRWPTRLIRCPEQNYDGKGAVSDSNGPYDDYNQNGQRDNGGYGSAAARPYGPYAITPASLLISTLPPFDPTSSYALGSDGAPGIAGFDDDSMNGQDDPGEVGWPPSDDPDSLATDPNDPTFALYSWLFDPSPNLTPAARATRRSQFVNNVVTGTAVTNVIGPQQNGFHDFFTFHTPLIVSAGQDKKLGLYEPSDLANFGYLAAPLVSPSVTGSPNATMQSLFDNITNLNQRPGGK